MRLVSRALAEVLLGQLVGVAAGRHRQLLRADLRIERALARQGAGDVAEGGLDGLFVAGDFDAFAHMRHVQVRPQRPAARRVAAGRGIRLTARVRLI